MMLDALNSASSNAAGPATRKALDKLSVVVVTPLGLGGRGGIDRLMDELRPFFKDTRTSNVDVTFCVSRGQSLQLLSILHLLRLTCRLAWLKLTSAVDVVHINLSQDGSSYRKLFVAWVCRRLSIPYILHLHGSRYRQFWNGAPPWLDRALVRMFSRSAFNLVLGTVWRDFVISKAPSSEPRIAIFPTATRDPGASAEKQSHTPLRILFSGRHGARKGVPELTAALGRLDGDKGWQATLTGDGEYEATRAEVARLGLSNRVDVPGWISVEAFEALLDDADILVLPSHDENLPLSIVEAFARSIAVVCTPVGAIPDIVEDGKSGLLVKPGDVEGLTRALARVLQDEPLRRSLGQQARGIFEQRLNLAAYADRLTELWRVAAGKG
jgi:glycosyltransferase involved in cell wall biosynthesis